jgi:uncharacterized cofD-like protein
VTNGSRPPGTVRRRSGWRWLRPGVGIKRWLFVVLVGELLLALALAIVIRQLYRDLPAGSPITALLDALSLQGLPLEARFLILVGLGLAVFLFGVWGLFRVLLEPFGVGDEPLAELIYQKRWRMRGPRVVTIGGGTGLSTLLRGLKELTSNITAVVTVADDGGSSGKLREALGVPPMGDIRNCMAALADAEPAMTQLLQYRFTQNGRATNGRGSDGLEGHAFGNLLIAALTEIEGDFEEAVRQSNRVLAVRGSVVPAAPVPVTLHAQLTDGSVLDGQSVIGRARGISRVWITPAEAHACREALAAIGAAELIVLGPGSLFTSLLPSLLVPGIREAIERSAAPCVYVCNVATQVGETEGFALSDHLAALRSHGLDVLLDAIVVNDNFNARAPAAYPAAPVRIDVPLRGHRPPIIARDIVDDDNAHHHDPVKLAGVLVDLHDRGALRKHASVRVAT